MVLAPLTLTYPPFSCQLQPCSVNGVSQLTECWHHASGCKAVRACARSRVWVCTEHKGRGLSRGDHRLLYKEVCVISAYLVAGQGKGEGLEQEKYPFDTHTHFSLLSLKKIRFFCGGKMGGSFSVQVTVIMFLVEPVTLLGGEAVCSSCPHLEERCACLRKKGPWERDAAWI